MKVFLSWSGSRSKQVAIAFKEWLPLVIQSIDAFVSSEDIEKGVRWNSEIAQELQDATFGIICVTKENLSASWLNFEAGALSKIMDNSHVAPFLFDIKPSELTGSPISQFQATSFHREDIKRLLETINEASGNILPISVLETTFNQWYTKLEEELNQYLLDKNKENSSEQALQESNILEEILETSRNTQRLIGNTDTKLYNSLDHLQTKVDAIDDTNKQRIMYENRKSFSRYSYPFYREILYSNNNIQTDDIYPYNILMLLSVYRQDFPWIYDAGTNLVTVLNSNISKVKKIREAEKFQYFLEMAFESLLKNDTFGNSKKELLLYAREIPRTISNMITNHITQDNQ